jgi:hypothetical protein
MPTARPRVDPPVGRRSGEPLPQRSGGDGQGTRQKLCQRRDGTTYSQRRDATLSADEIDAVRRTFGDDDRAFTKVALRTYCS